jgi:hypothetical protein
MKYKEIISLMKIKAVNTCLISILAGTSLATLHVACFFKMGVMETLRTISYIVLVIATFAATYWVSNM